MSLQGHDLIGIGVAGEPPHVELGNVVMLLWLVGHLGSSLTLWAFKFRPSTLDLDLGIQVLSRGGALSASFRAAISRICCFTLET